ncbi:ABC-2 type transport system ATP-binding protein [Ruminococcaceae bacterium YRB3002]|nr:ABC-2 type transport system ATP-binding protein [Ruminococcaceae bacterium YRB3002]
MEFVISHLAKSYGKHQVLTDVDYAFEEGKIYGLLGRNGSGKTTLFNCLNSDTDVNAGSFFFRKNGKNEPVEADDIGYVLSTPTVPDFMTGREFLKFFIDIHSDVIKDPKTLDEYLDYMMIPKDTRDRLMKDYSHGTKNKMQMLINIIASPRLMLLDEPLTSLDVVVAEEMKDILRTQKEGRVLIFSTHLLDIALDLCDEIVLLNHGRLEPVDKANLDDDDFKIKIIEALRDATDA